MDDQIRELVHDLRQGYLTRRGFFAKAAGLGISTAAALALLGDREMRTAAAAPIEAPAAQPRGWQRGRGWGWVWGPNDQLGNLNELTPELTMRPPPYPPSARVYARGLPYDR